MPVERTGILAGTTARWLLDHADELGWTTAERMITPAELAGDGRGLVHLLGPRSGRRSGPLDGTPLPYTADPTLSASARCSAIP